MAKKSTKKTGFQKKMFKNLDDIFQFESELIEKEENITWIDKKPSKNYTLNSFFANPKTNKTIHIDPNDKEAVKHFTELGFIPSWEQTKKEISEIPNKLTEDPKTFFQTEAKPIIFESKSKTSPSVPYLRVFLKSSIGEEKSIHYIHSKIRKS